MGGVGGDLKKKQPPQPLQRHYIESQHILQDQVYHGPELKPDHDVMERAFINHTTPISSETQHYKVWT